MVCRARIYGQWEKVATVAFDRCRNKTQRGRQLGRALISRETGKSYKRKCQDKYFPLGSVPVLFCLGIQPNCLNVVSYSESGLLQAKGFALSPRARRRCDCSPLWFHFAVVTAPIVF